MKLHQSGDKIKVTELNPMSDAPHTGSFMAFFTWDDVCPATFIRKDGEFYCFDNGYLHGSDHLSGWLPMPVYEPETK